MSLSYEGEHIMWSQVKLNKVNSCYQKCYQYEKTVIDGHFTTYIFSYLNIYIWLKNTACVYQQQEGFILHDSFAFLYFWINISKIYIISTIRTKIWAYYLKQFVTTCFQIQVRIILFLFLVTYLAFILFLLVCGNFSLTLKTGRCRNLL